MKKMIIQAAAAAVMLTAAVAGPALAATTFAGVPSSTYQVVAHDVHLHAGQTVHAGGRAYTVQGVQNYPGGSTVFQVRPALPAADVHHSVPFTG